MKNRPYLNAGIDELEARLESGKADRNTVREVDEELSFRSSSRARKLRSLTQQLLQKHERADSPERMDERTRTAPSARPQAGGAAPTAPVAQPSSRLQGPEAVLTAWAALEVLSPQSAFRSPKDLAAGDAKAVAELDGPRLPWLRGTDRAKPRHRLFYQLVLGTVDLEKASAELLQRYQDGRPELVSMGNEVPLAVLVLDHAGVPVEEPAVSVSSFAWGLPRALQGGLSALSGWREAERRLVTALDRRARGGEEPPGLSRVAIDGLFQWLVGELGLPRALVKPPAFALRKHVPFAVRAAPEPLLLSGFFLNDLLLARELVVQGKAPKNLLRYLGELRPVARRDLLNDPGALEQSVAPSRTPPARWPGPGRNPLVLLQQAAVNEAVHDLRDGGIVAVNGPPGTGKTTLLRDMVAAVVTARAEVLAKLEDPEAAFTDSGTRLKAGQAEVALYRLAAEVKGHELLVASSNNKAVENVSAELPAATAVAEELLADLRYFTTTSDALRKGPTWGLVAAVLGNAQNRREFREAFWKDPDVGLESYLATVRGLSPVVEVGGAAGEVTSRPPKVVTEERAPRSRDEARRRWQQVQSRFQAALARSRAALAELEEVRRLATALPSLEQCVERLERDERTCGEAVSHTTQAHHDASARVAAAEVELGVAQARVRDVVAARPTWWARLFRTSAAREWYERVRHAEAQRTQAASGYERARAALAEAVASAARAQDVLARTQLELASVRQQLARAQEGVSRARSRLGAHFGGPEYFEQDHAAKHLGTPWLDAEVQRLRDAVFVEAMALHKAFVDSAAKPIKHNLTALMREFGMGLPPVAKPLLAELWATLFLVVPLVSTTFASVERMLGALPAESLGWLLVDEAGQAVPQAAVGALLRTRRAVVVGDPMQIEPVVALPEALTRAICEQLGARPERFSAPSASVQSLADAASPVVSTFDGREGQRTVGVPLLVHRRCAEPMFGISNAVAYEGLMVGAKSARESRIGAVLGPSTWLHVEGAGQGHWCEGEGRVVLRLLTELVRADVPLNLYVISPFRAVVHRIGDLLARERLLAGVVQEPWTWVREHVGTVHTVQGREAEAVILVLGAPEASQGGPRAWAGRTPNLLNVAVTRAKERLYVVGNRKLWSQAGYFSALDARLPTVSNWQP